MLPPQTHPSVAAHQHMHTTVMLLLLVRVLLMLSHLSSSPFLLIPYSFLFVYFYSCTGTCACVAPSVPIACACRHIESEWSSVCPCVILPLFLFHLLHLSFVPPRSFCVRPSTHPSIHLFQSATPALHSFISLFLLSAGPSVCLSLPFLCCPVSDRPA